MNMEKIMKDRFTQNLTNYCNNKGRLPEHVTMSSETCSKLTDIPRAVVIDRGLKLFRVKIIINEWINKNQFIFY